MLIELLDMVQYYLCQNAICHCHQYEILVGIIRSE